MTSSNLLSKVKIIPKNAVHATIPRLREAEAVAVVDATPNPQYLSSLLVFLQPDSAT
jgi:hypothetical protein